MGYNPSGVNLAASRYGPAVSKLSMPHLSKVGPLGIAFTVAVSSCSCVSSSLSAHEPRAHHPGRDCRHSILLEVPILATHFRLFAGLATGMRALSSFTPDVDSFAAFIGISPERSIPVFILEKHLYTSSCEDMLYSKLAPIGSAFVGSKSLASALLPCGFGS